MILYAISKSQSSTYNRESFLLSNSRAFLFVLTGFSQLSASLSIVTVLLMVTGSSLAAPAKSSIGQPVGIASPPVLKSYIYNNILELSKLVGETQAEFVS